MWPLAWPDSAPGGASEVSEQTHTPASHTPFAEHALRDPHTITSDQEMEVGWEREGGDHVSERTGGSSQGPSKLQSGQGQP